MACLVKKNQSIDMRQLFLGVVFFSTTGILQAQFAGHYNALNIAGSTNTLKSEIPLASPSVVGSTYLDEEWQGAEILLKDGNVITELPVRVEIEQGNVEIQFKGEIKFLNLDRVDSLKLVSRESGPKWVIKKADAFQVDQVPLKGIAMVYPGSPCSVVKHLYIEFLPANYNVAMDVGSRDHRKVKKEKFYLTRGTDLVLVKGSEKKIVKQLGIAPEQALTIIKDHGLRLSREKDLLAFIELL
jgi:hypothetical protein